MPPFLIGSPDDREGISYSYAEDDSSESGSDLETENLIQFQPSPVSTGPLTNVHLPEDSNEISILHTLSMEDVRPNQGREVFLPWTVPHFNSINNGPMTPALTPVGTELVSQQRHDHGQKRSAVEESPSPSSLASSSVKRQRLEDSMYATGTVPTDTTLVVDVVVHKEPEKEIHRIINDKYLFGMMVWKGWIDEKNAEIGMDNTLNQDLVDMPLDELNFALFLFIHELSTNTDYEPDTIYFFLLSLMNYISGNGRVVDVFFHPQLMSFIERFDKEAKKFGLPSLERLPIQACVLEEHLWECNQFGSHSPYVLLNTILYFNSKYFKMKTVEEHLNLTFFMIVKHKKYKYPHFKSFLRLYRSGTTSVFLNNRIPKFFCQQEENTNDPSRCPVALYSLYLEKCPEVVKCSRNYRFYLTPASRVSPDTATWYSTDPLDYEIIAHMLNRIKLIKPC